jgi:hypothetical protein
MSTNKSKRTTASRPAQKITARESAGISMPSAVDQDAEKSTWTQMYSISERWRLDMDFFCDELVFFTGLIDKYFMGLLAEKDLEGTQKTVAELSELDSRQIDFVHKLVQHQQRLTNLIQDPFSHEVQLCQQGHVELEKEISEFVRDFRLVKRKVFQLAANAIESQKVKHLLKE